MAKKQSPVEALESKLLDLQLEILEAKSSLLDLRQETSVLREVIRMHDDGLWKLNSGLAVQE